MIKPQRRIIGQLECIVVDGGPAPKNFVVVCHGYGANQEDLAPLSLEWISLLGDQSIDYRFIFPNAPHSLAELGMPFGRAWWPINMARLAEMVQASAFDELHQHEPPGIDLARSALSDLISQACAELGCKDGHYGLGGFSQGAMLSMDVALRGEVVPPSVLLQFSGTMICQDAWSAVVGDRLKQTSVFQSHGTLDPILPFSSAECVKEMLKDSDVKVEFHSFDGPHTIDTESISKSGRMLKDLRAL